jgi:microsomal dipeptidase-like Zn-dependent dipeptidase
VDLVSRLFNYEGPGDTPSVTIELMKAGDVGIALSVLYSPLDEIDLNLPYGSPPMRDYADHLLDQLDLVEGKVTPRDDAMIVRDHTTLEDALAQGTVGLVHCVEGGFALGPKEVVRDTVGRLASRGVAYITLAHLFWRQVATNAPALPFLPDWLYRLLFRQHGEGLGEVGRAALDAMLEKGIIVDVTHMDGASLDETLGVLDDRDHDGRIPVIASHAACNFDGLDYNLTDDHIRRIADHGGVIGVISCRHYINRNLPPRRPRTLDDSVQLVGAHVDHICKVTKSFDHVAIGSDLDGYIKPALPHLEHMGRMAEFQERLEDRYGAANAQKLCSDNALRVLRSRFS